MITKVEVPSIQKRVSVGNNSGSSEVVRKENSQASSSIALGTFCLSAGIGIGGYFLGRSLGGNNGYNRAKAEDTIAIQKLQQGFVAKDMEISYLHAQLQAKEKELMKKDAEIDRLNGVVENLAKTVKLQQLQNTAPILSSGNEGSNGDSQLN